MLCIWRMDMSREFGAKLSETQWHGRELKIKPFLFKSNNNCYTFKHFTISVVRFGPTNPTRSIHI